MTTPTRFRRGAVVRSLRRRVGRAFMAILLLLALLLAAVVLALVDFTTRGDDVIQRWSPAYALSQNVLADLVNQETGVRGYALGRHAGLLDPYTEYLTRQRTDEAALRRAVAGRSVLEHDLSAFQTAAERWRAQVALPLIRRVRAGDPTAAAQLANPQINGAFDRIRHAAAQLTADVRNVRAGAEHERAVALRLVWVVIVATAVLLVLIASVLWRGLRRAVLEPVGNLAEQTRVVATGDIARRIVASGPPEIAALGTDVDAMRARIADELARVEAARAELLERSEDLARSNADLEQFAYVASHDLSEPLRKVANFCQLLERQYADQLDDKARQYIGFAVDGAKRMQALIGDLLEFSRVGRTSEEFVPIELDVVLARALANLEQRIADASAEIDADPLPTVPGDASLLSALFQNLVGNAVKYRGEQPPRIRIESERDGDGWRFTVTDNGIGIDPKYADRIFAIFQRLHLRDQYGGTGIGLALCRKIVEFHGGRIWLDTDHQGPGARFGFTLADRVSVRDSPSA